MLLVFLWVMCYILMIFVLVFFLLGILFDSE